MRAAGLRALAAFGLAVLASIVLLGPPSIVLGDEPTPAPPATSGPPTCADRFPAEGPAGVDLRLGCIFGEIVGLYTASEGRPPTPLSSYAIAAGILIVGGLIVAWFVSRLVARRAGRRLAPVLPGEWWVCATCRSLNGAHIGHCYSCGADRPDGPMLPTDEHPGIAQSFGERRKRG